MSEDPEDVTQYRRATDPLIVRIDERTRVMAEELKILRATLVSRAEFNPIKMLVYGLVGLMLTAVFTALIAQVVISK